MSKENKYCRTWAIKSERYCKILKYIAYSVHRNAMLQVLIQASMLHWQFFDMHEMSVLRKHEANVQISFM